MAAVGVGTALALALSPGTASSGPGTAGGTTGASLAASRPASSPAATPPRSATSPPPSPGACLIGTWRTVNQQLISTINGQQIVFTGSGAVSTFLTDGTIMSTYDNEVFRATVDGVPWTEDLLGSATGHWAVDGGDILYSSLTSSGTETLYDDGIYNNSGPLEALPGAVPYQCSGNTLRESFPTGGSDQLTRVSR